MPNTKIDNPLVTIIINCYNRSHYIERTIESVLAQNYKPVEIIVMDDGSTDGTYKVVSKYKKKLNLYRQENQGIAIARTNAAKLAKGELIAFQDDDDLMHPDRVVNLYKAMCKFPDAVMATGDYAVIDSDGSLTGQRWLPGALDETDEPKYYKDGREAIFYQNVTSVLHTALFRKCDGERVYWFDRTFKYACSDTDFLVRLCTARGIVYLRDIVTYYRRGHEAIWSNQLRANYSRLQLFVKHYVELGEKDSSLKKHLQVRIYNSMRLINKYKNKDQKSINKDLLKYHKKAYKLLGVKRRLMYACYLFLISPVDKFKVSVRRKLKPTIV